MLILTRKPEEAVIIQTSTEIILKILSIEGKQVRFGIDAPPSVLVYRYEVYQQLKDRNDLLAKRTTKRQE